MAWDSDPKIRDLANYSKKHGYDRAVVIGLNSGDGTFSVTTYGVTAALCKNAAKIGDEIFNLIADGTINTEN